MSARAWQVRITVRLAVGVNDPQGNTVRDGLHGLGHTGVRDVRVGKIVDLIVDADDADAATAEADTMCQQLLANPVIETYEIAVSEAGAG